VVGLFLHPGQAVLHTRLRLRQYKQHSRTQLKEHRRFLCWNAAAAAAAVAGAAAEAGAATEAVALMKHTSGMNPAPPEHWPVQLPLVCQLAVQLTGHGL
jgi:hypothetical protein